MSSRFIGQLQENGLTATFYGKGMHLTAKYFSKGEQVPDMGGVIEYLDADEINAVLNAPDKGNHNARLVLRFLASTGVRVTEMLNVTWKEVNLIPGEERVRIYTLKKRKRNRIVRTVPLDDRELIELLYYRRPRNYDPEERIFNVTRQAVFLMVKRYGKKAGIRKRVYPHIFRHSYAVERLKSGLDLRTLQRLLGHTKLDDTATYLQITDFDIRDKVKKASLGW